VYLIASVFAADECWTKYRQHDDSCVAVVRRSGQYDQVRRRYLKWLKQYLRSTGTHNSDIQKLIVHALRKTDPWMLRWVRRQWRRVRHRLSKTTALQPSS
jgi:hypothetical protein